MTKRMMLLVVAVMAAMAVGAWDFSGIVYCDRNGNGVQDKGEKGIKGIAVTNGDTIVLTDRKGRYVLPYMTGNSVLPILPADYTMAGHRVVNANFAFMDGQKEGNRADFGLVKKRVNKRFRLNAVGDVQVGNYQEVDYALRTLWPELLQPEQTVSINLFLGDLVNNSVGLYGDLRELMEQLPQQTWTVLGNHDRDVDSICWRQARTYNEMFGADMYAFNEGCVHFIILNNVCPDGTRGYKNHLTERQLRFVEQDLKYVPKGKLIVLSMHIPLAYTDNRNELFRLLSGRGDVLAITAHLHQVARFFHQAEGVRIHELGAGASCGFWWVGERDVDGVPAALQQEGTPRNYFVIDFDGRGYQLRCKAIGMDERRQMTIRVTGIDTLDTYLRDLKRVPPGQLLLTVYGGSDSTRVRCRLDGGEWLACRKDSLMDPNVARIREMNHLKAYPTRFSRVNPFRHRSSHQLWSLPLPASCRQGAHTVEVEADDRWGFRASGCRSFCFPKQLQ